MAVGARHHLLHETRGRGAALDAAEILHGYGGACAAVDIASPAYGVAVQRTPTCVPPATAKGGENFFSDAAAAPSMSGKRARGEEQYLGAAAHAKRRRVLGVHPAVSRQAQAQVETMSAEAQQWRRYAAHVAAAARAAVARRIKAKDEEVERARWLCWALHEQLLAARAEARAWRDAAASGEAAAAALRADLDHALLRAQEQALAVARPADAVEDAESCCYGDNDGDDMAVAVERGAAVSAWAACRGCGERPAAVLLLPCRHLCACAPCAAAAPACPACGGDKVGSVAVNFVV
ncbi:hypothetical protein ACP70R_045579 [Stipagrostis hirtigluma subsp. patula]